MKNTFGDQVHYLSLGDFFNKKFKKNMYVSPFIEMDCNYKISVKLSEKSKFFCSINQFDNQDKQTSIIYRNYSAKRADQTLILKIIEGLFVYILLEK